jgi:hypothetical protein
MMKRFMVTAIVAVSAASVALLAVRSEAHASASGDPRIVVLQKQVQALQKQVSRLQDEMRWNWDGDTCQGAVTADLIQGTWIVIDQATQKTSFGPQTQVSEYGTCGRLINPKVPRSSPITVPPTINQLVPLLKWLGG